MAPALRRLFGRAPLRVGGTPGPPRALGPPGRLSDLRIAGLRGSPRAVRSGRGALRRLRPRRPGTRAAGDPRSGATPSRTPLLPLLTLLGLILPALLSGSVIIEKIFAWPGLGRLYFDSILSRDYPVVLALSLLGAVATLAAALAADIAVAAADPRVRDGTLGPS